MIDPGQYNKIKSRHVILHAWNQYVNEVAIRLEKDVQLTVLAQLFSI